MVFAPHLVQHYPTLVTSPIRQPPPTRCSTPPRVYPALTSLLALQSSKMAFMLALQVLKGSQERFGTTSEQAVGTKLCDKWPLLSDVNLTLAT